MSTPTLNDILATNIAGLMEKAGYTQASLAKLSGVGQTTISLYLNPSRRQPSKSGKVPSAKFGEVEALAEVLGVPPWDLLRPYDVRAQAASQASRTARRDKGGGLINIDAADDPFQTHMTTSSRAPWNDGKTIFQSERDTKARLNTRRR